MTENTLLIILLALVTIYGILCWVWDILRDRVITERMDSLFSGSILTSNTITDTFTKLCQLYEEHKKISVKLNDKYHIMSHDLQQIKHRLDTIRDKQKKAEKKKKNKTKTVFQEPTDYVIKGNKNYMPEVFKKKKK